jgi:cell wall-associated NlpC family hydrolase
VDPAVLRGELRAVLPAGAQVEVLREVVVVRQAGEFLTNVQLVRVLRAAQSRLGDRYVWGAVGPNTFDCSGLVGWSYAQAGISLPRTSEQQWFAGVHVPVREMRPGDLLFWHYDPTDPADIDHVALYIGRGMMIVAPHTGTVVQVQPVYSADFAGVVRVDPKVAAQVGGPRFAVAATPS